MVTAVLIIRMMIHMMMVVFVRKMRKTAFRM